VQEPQRAELPDLGRDAPVEEVAAEVEPLEPTQLAVAVRQRADEAVAVGIEHNGLIDTTG